MSHEPFVFAVYGAGAWGTALAMVLARAGQSVKLVMREDGAAEAAERSRSVPRLPGVLLHDNIEVTADIGVLGFVDAVLLATPAQTTRSVADFLRAVLKPGIPVITCAKGIEQHTGLLLTEVLEQFLTNHPLAVLSGPGFAAEVARDMPTAITIAASDQRLADDLARAFAGSAFRPYSSGDPSGVQLGGALKNVLAIAAGIVDGQQLGASAEAAVITRGFVEMRRLAGAWGGKADTLMGLSGFGDLILTCRSEQSRNFSYGRAIGRGDGLSTSGKVVEGAATASIAVERARGFGIETPIMAAVADVVGGGMTVADVIDLLLSRPLKREDHL